MADIDLKTLTYMKQEIDDKISDERNITNLQLDLKLDSSEVGGSEGILQLVGGKVPSSNIPFATSLESSDGTLLNVVMSPALVKQEIDTYKALYIPSADKGEANGVAPLGADSKINMIYLPDNVAAASRYEFNQVNSNETTTATYSPLNSININNAGADSIWELKLSLTYKYSSNIRSAYFRYRVINNGVVGDWIEFITEANNNIDNRALTFTLPTSAQANGTLTAEVEFKCELEGDILNVPYCALVADRKV